MTPPRVDGGQERQAYVQQRANERWQARINTPKGNPNAPQTFMNQGVPGGGYGVQDQYAAYCQQCMSCGQTPMSQLQYMQALSQGTDPIVTVQSGVQTGKTIAGLVSDVIGLFKGNKSTAKVTPEKQQELKALNADYTQNMKTKGEFEVKDVNKLVDSIIANLNSDGDGNSVSTDKLIENLTDVCSGGGADDNTVKGMVTTSLKAAFGDAANISKSDLQKLFKEASKIGNGKVGPSELLDAMGKIAEKDRESDITDIDNAMKAKGYECIIIEQEGVSVHGYRKGGEVILETNTERMNQILSE